MTRRSCVICLALLALAVPATAGELREAVRQGADAGMDPEVLWSLADDRPYTVEIFAAAAGDLGRFDMVLTRRDRANGRRVLPERLEPAGEPGEWSRYASNPLRGKSAADLVPRLRRELRRRDFDVLINCGLYFKTVLPTRFARARRKLGYGRDRANDLIWLFVDTRSLHQNQL